MVGRFSRSMHIRIALLAGKSLGRGRRGVRTGRCGAASRGVWGRVHAVLDALPMGAKSGPVRAAQPAWSPARNALVWIVLALNGGSYEAPVLWGLLSGKQITVRPVGRGDR